MLRPSRRPSDYPVRRAREYCICRAAALPCKVLRVHLRSRPKSFFAPLRRERALHLPHLRWFESWYPGPLRIQDTPRPFSDLANSCKRVAHTFRFRSRIPTEHHHRRVAATLPTFAATSFFLDRCHPQSQLSNHVQSPNRFPWPQLDRRNR